MQYFWWGCRGNLRLITLRNERVKSMATYVQVKHFNNSLIPVSTPTPRICSIASAVIPRSMKGGVVLRPTATTSPRVNQWCFGHSQLCTTVRTCVSNIFRTVSAEWNTAATRTEQYISHLTGTSMWGWGKQCSTEGQGVCRVFCFLIGGMFDTFSGFSMSKSMRFAWGLTWLISCTAAMQYAIFFTIPKKLPIEAAIGKWAIHHTVLHWYVIILCIALDYLSNHITYV